uniref:Vomeronasal type-1 receptor n=1 Tax=Spermophilus dauricus TaxID=99837 RepID=A0A8C9QDA9_SPEDA
MTNRLYSNIHIRNTMYTVIGVGVMANALLLLVHISLHISGNRPKPTDLPIGLLALNHLAILLIKGFIASDIFIPQGGRWDDLTFKLLIYLYRLMRGFSICATCLLSVLQAITLSPRNSCLAKFKHKYSLHNLAWTLLTLWVFNVFFNVRVLVSMGGPSNDTAAFRFVSESCTVAPTGHYFRTFFSLMGILRDIFLMGLMAASSGYMVALLCRHKRQCQHLHSTSLSPRVSPELRATRTILLLMGLFVLMYFMDCVFSSSSGQMHREDPTRLGVQMLVGNGYATLSALILICAEKRIINFFQSTLGKADGNTPGHLPHGAHGRLQSQSTLQQQKNLF